MLPGRANFEIEGIDGVMVVRLRGWFFADENLDRLEQTVREFVEWGRIRVVLNLKDARLGGVALLGVIVRTFKRIQDREGRMAARRPEDESFRKALVIVKLEHLLDFYDTEEEAIAHCRE